MSFEKKNFGKNNSISVKYFQVLHKNELKFNPIVGFVKGDTSIKHSKIDFTFHFLLTYSLDGAIFLRMRAKNFNYILAF